MERLESQRATHDESTGAKDHRADAVVRALSLFGPVLVIALLCKFHKGVKLAPSASFLDMVGLWGEDVVVFGAATLLLALALALTRGWRRAAMIVCAHLGVPLLGSFMLLEHVYFLVSGTVGDLHIVIDVLSRLSGLAGVIGSEATALRVVLLSSPLALSAAAAWYARNGHASQYVQTMAGSRGYPRAAPLLGGGIALAAFLALARPPDGALGLVDANVFLGLSRDGLRLWADQEGVVELAPSPVIPLRLKPGKPAKAKNIVTLVLESTAALRTSAYRASPDTTPFLRSLVERGTLVDEAYTVVPHTSKALVSIHCGIYPRIWPSIDEANTAGIPSPCLPRLLREEGFATGYFQAAEENYERRADLVREFGFEDFAGKESLPSDGFDESSYFGFEDRVLVGPVLDWIDAHRDQRFYASILTLASHHPYFLPAGWARKSWHSQTGLNDYLNTLAYVDDVVAQLFAGLEARGLLEDTLVIITGDHGEGFGEHGRRQHDAVIYEEGLRVPLLLVGAGAERGARVSGLWQAIDVLPTALDALGFEPDGPLMGRSVLSGRGHEELFFSCHHYNYCMALRRGDHKFVYHYAHRSPEVFHLAGDPGEQVNLLETDAADEVVPVFNLALAEMKRRKHETEKAYLASRQSRVGVYVKRTPPARISRPLDVVFDEGVRLLGYDVSRPVFEAGDKTVVTLFYEVMRELPLGVEPFLRVEGPHPLKTNQVPVEGAYPAAAWRAGDFIEDRHTFSTRPDWAVGEYTFVTGLHRKVVGGTWSRSVPKTASGARLVPEGVALSGFTMTKPHLDASEFVATNGALPESQVSVQFGPCIRLVATEIDKPKLSGGLKTTVTHTFAASCTPEADLQMFVVLDGPTRKEFVHSPVNGNYGLARWRKDDVVTDPMAVITHTRDRRGIYRVLLGVRRADGSHVEPNGHGLPLHDSMVEVAQYRLVD